MSTIHAHVGAKIKTRRAALGITPNAFANDLDISTADLALYESGRRRICVSLLFACANSLEVEIGYFFRDMRFATKNRPQDARQGYISSIKASWHCA